MCLGLTCNWKQKAFWWFLDYTYTLSFLHTFLPILSCQGFLPWPAHHWCQPQKRACRSLTHALPIQSRCESFLTQSVGSASQLGDTDRMGDCKNVFPRKRENPENAISLDENSSFSDLTTSSRFNLFSMRFVVVFFFNFDSLGRTPPSFYFYPHF